MAGQELNHEAVREAIRRTFLPFLLFVPDVAQVLQTSEQAAHAAILQGTCGPYVFVGERLAVRRDSFLATLAANEVAPDRASSPMPDGGTS